MRELSFDNTRQHIALATKYLREQPKEGVVWWDSQVEDLQHEEEVGSV